METEDTTRKFSEAVDHEMVVLKAGNSYNVFKKDDLKKALNEKPLKRPEVNSFIASLF
jgi:hypothetical protein